MRIAQAREVIGAAISARILACFRADWAEIADLGGPVPGSLTMRMGEYAPGHDAGRVPPVPTTQVSIHRGAGTPGLILTWKVEGGDPPTAMLDVASDWLARVAWPGYAVLDGYPVLEIVEADQAGRPARVVVVTVSGGFDERMHGWRAYGATRTLPVVWSAGAARLAAATDAAG